MGFEVVLFSRVESDYRSDLGLDHASLLGIVQHFLLFSVEHIQGARVSGILNFQLADPESSLVGLNSTMAADGTLHLLVADLAAFIVKHCRISDLGLNN